MQSIHISKSFNYKWNLTPVLWNCSKTKTILFLPMIYFLNSMKLRSCKAKCNCQGSGPFLEFHSRSDWCHKLCRDFVVLAVPVTRAKGRLSIESQCKILWKLSKTFNLHEITQFRLDMVLACLHFWSVSYKKNDVVFMGKNRKLKMFPVHTQWEFASAVPFSSATGGVSAVTE